MKDFSSFLSEARSGGRDADGKKIKNRIEPVTKTGKNVSELRGGAKTSAIKRLRKQKEEQRAGEQGEEETREERRARLRKQRDGQRALEKIQKEDRKEKHEKKKATGKAGVKELKKTQKSNETQKRMEAGAREQHERKKEIGKAGAKELKKTFSDAKKNVKDEPTITPEQLNMEKKKAAAKARSRQQKTDAKLLDAARRGQESGDKNPSPSSTGAKAGDRDEFSKPKPKRETSSSSSRTAGERLDRERAAVARRERSKLPVSGDDIKSYGKKRAIKYQLGQKSLPKEKRQSLETRKRTARRLARVGPGDVVRAKIDREIRKAKAEPITYAKNVAGKTINRTVKPAGKLAKSVATSATKSGTSQAAGGDAQVGKGTSKDRG